ncbi:MAG: transglutaminase domain-containing protein [Chloroflexi bacterium]|nr:transglutaminase domain-containing protein [Chloroflexota bacterium]
MTHAVASPSSGGGSPGQRAAAVRDFLVGEATLYVLLFCSMLVVTWSVEQAEWVTTPSLALVALLGVLTGVLMAKVRVHPAVKHTAGLLLGVATIVWQTLTIIHVDGVAPRMREVALRLGLWVQAAATRGVSSDDLPFVFLLVLITWLLAYICTWLVSRRNYWGAVLLPGSGLLLNLSQLPPSYLRFFLLYAFTAMLLRVRMDSLAEEYLYLQRHTRRPPRMGFARLRNGALFGVAVIAVAYLLPIGPSFSSLNRVYDRVHYPGERLTDDFVRLFAGLPARKPSPYHSFSDVIALQGSIDPGDSTALMLQAQAPLYLRARTYDLYTSKGWKSSDSKTYESDWKPTYTKEEPYSKRYSITYTVNPGYSTDLRFAAGDVQSIDQPITLETYDSPTYTLDLTDQSKDSALPDSVKAIAARLRTAASAAGVRRLEKAAIQKLLPQDMDLLDVKYRGAAVQQVKVARQLPEGADIVSYHTGKGVTELDPYQVTVWLSEATPTDLRSAGADYPGWVLDRYLQLPSTLPDRVKALALQVTEKASNPYDKAMAIQEHLSSLDYSTDIKPAPFDVDSVDYFLFNLRKGYCDYFASAMAVLSRSVGIPSRLAAGYAPGDYSFDGYVVKDSDAHSWVQIYFPGYGWIDFEPTPGSVLPAPQAHALDEASDTADIDSPTPFSGDDPYGDDLSLLLGSDGSYIGDSPQESTLLWKVAMPLAALLVLVLLWRRFLWPSGDPGATYSRMCSLSALSGAGPKPGETPYEYARALARTLPEAENEVWSIAHSYVLKRYGRLEPDTKERSKLRQDWLSIRFRLLGRAVRPSR